MSTQGHESEAINVSGLKASLKKGGNVGIYNEAICSTAGGTAAKVTNTTPPSFSLVAGAKILVKFTYAISAENATLQVGGNTAKPIYYKGSALPADLVKAGTSLLLSYDGTSFNIVGDINTDTTYSTMGASGSTHASGLVPDTPSVAGTTKFLREDGTWQEPSGQNYSAGDGIDITNNEISVDSTVALKTDLAPAKLGSGIGTCSTSSGTALEVVLSDYNLVQNGFVAVTFANDVPAGATLNINSKGAKPLYYKGAAITADIIKADDTAVFSYDGTNYVLCSSGAGGSAPVNPNETVNISLTQIGGNSADLTGASITITDDDSGDTIYTATWTGTMLTTEIDVNTNYTVSVETIAGYLACEPQSYQAGYQTERYISFQYIAPGAYIEATDHSLYTSSSWSSSGKTANCVVLITSTLKRRISLVATRIDPISTAAITASLSNYISPESYESALLDYDGNDNTEKMVAFSKANNTYNQQTAAPYCNMYTFPDGVTKAYMPAMGEAHTIGINYNAQIKPCLEACDGNLLTLVAGIADIASSSASTSAANNIWTCRITASGVGSSYMGKGEPCYALPIAVYE